MNQSFSWQLTIPFKGDRTYIQGGDVYDKLVEAFGSYARMRLQFHKLLAASPLLSLVSTPAELASFSASCIYTTDVSTLYIGLSEPQATLESTRHPYDEPAAVADAVQDEETIELTAPFRFSFIEHTIALNKVLMRSVFPDRHGKWLFTKLDMQRHPTDFRCLRLRFRTAVGTRLTVSDIEVDDQRVGQISFTEVQATS